ncbi:unnamed protein product [Euphydryas editha]|uniref:Uncharacterized protein n=1 Tax=Euphydryas editha TaxID=104508 RepID=A0AAU9US40_EUPED|nr:unnamed protein product [Euphydryas editha]
MSSLWWLSCILFITYVNVNIVQCHYPAFYGSGYGTQYPVIVNDDDDDLKTVLPILLLLLLDNGGRCNHNCRPNIIPILYPIPVPVSNPM